MKKGTPPPPTKIKNKDKVDINTSLTSPPAKPSNALLAALKAVAAMGNKDKT